MSDLDRRISYILSFILDISMSSSTTVASLCMLHIRMRVLNHRCLPPEFRRLSILFDVCSKLGISKLYPPIALSRSITLAMRSILAPPAMKNRSICSLNFARFRGSDLSSIIQTRSVVSASLFISRLVLNKVEKICCQNFL